MPKLDQTVARNIVTEAIAIRSNFPQAKIRADLSIINDLRIDQVSMEGIRKRISRQVELIGFQAKFSPTDFSKARTVGDLIHVVVSLTESGGPD